MGAHDGHRKRMKARFLRDGADNLHDHELLELMLYYAIPRADTNTLSHALLDRFGSLRGVMEASVEALCDVQGLGAHGATLLKTCAAVYRRMEQQGAESICVLRTAEDAAAYIAPRYRDADCESVHLVCLDARGRVLSCQEIARGLPTQVEISVRRIVELALQHKAQGVLLFHNHINVGPRPSREDEVVTLQISEALSSLGITLTDHIILSETEYFSMSESGALSHMRRPFSTQAF